VWALALLVGTGRLAGGAGAGDAGQEPPLFRSSTRLVEVYVTVTDSRGALVTGLPVDAFDVLEDGRLQKVAVFSEGDSPVAMAIGIDRSFSMRGDRLSAARRAARALLATLRPRDRSMILAVGSEVEVAFPLGHDHAAASAALGALTPWGTTPLYDAVVRGIAHLAGDPGRRALVLLTDGDDRYSQATPADALRVARESGVLVYPVVLGRRSPRTLAELADVSGGRRFEAPDAAAIEPAFAGVADELRHQYLIGYQPPASRPGERGAWRAITVIMKQPGLRARARTGYVVEEGPTPAPGTSGGAGRHSRKRAGA